MLSTPEMNDDDEDEHFVDAPSEPEDAGASDAPKPSKTPQNSLHYDGRKRDPDHAHADLACLWEILPFATHFHPSVTLFATRFLHDQEMPPKPDPSSHTLMHFLDRFAYRNAKSKPTTGKGTSIMQPMAGATGADLLIRTRDGARAEAPVNSEAFWRKKVEEVPADEVFFHKYFETSGKKAAADKKKKGKDKGEDAEGSDAEEDEIWKALVGSRPEVEGPGDDESDDDLEALEDAMGEGDDDEDDEDGGVVIADAPDDDEEMEDTEEGAEEGDDLELDSADEGAFLGSDEELPSDLEGIPDDEADWEDEEESAPKKKGKTEDEGDKRGKKKRKLKHLPTFASAEDYAKLLEDEDDY